MTAGDRRGGAIQPSLSDPHREGRTVAILTFASGLKLVYKPKDLGAEAAYNALLDWLNRRGAPLEFRVCRVLNRTTHGWVEFVEARPCADHREAREYFRRVGMLLCLIYALEGTDCHQDNIIASGPHPVLVDVESLLTHRMREDRPAESTDAEILADRHFAHSVLRTGLLPVWELDQQAQVAFNVGGLGGVAGEVKVPVPTWTHVNTDYMSLGPESVAIPVPANVPSLDGVPLRLEDHVPEVIAGFEAMYRFLLARREALLAADSPLHAFRGQRVRFVFRATRIYALLLQTLLDPGCLREGVDRSIQLDQVSRASLAFESRPEFWPLLRAEREALEQGDIPLFTARTDQDAVETAGGGAIAGVFSGPSDALAVERLRALDAEDLNRQVALIQGMLSAHFGHQITPIAAQNASISQTDHQPPRPASPAAAGDPLPPRELSGEALVARALRIAEEMHARAIRGADGSATWVVPQLMWEAQRYQYAGAGGSLYDGSAGISLFLAALDSIAGAGRFGDLALGALRQVRQDLGRRGDRLADHMGIGGAAGLGGLAYALARIAGFLQEPDLLDDAARAAALITRDRIAADHVLDVVGGAAGAILGLLGVHAMTGDSDALERARACGRHLVTAQTATPSGHRAWPAADGKFMTGFSHGAAGIAYALLRLYRATGEEDLLRAAEDAIAYEDSLFSAAAENWPDLRGHGEPGFVAQWCHGTPGIAL
ncbi:MAG: type 2 lantipeptide synthetase LanM, partial [Armatimonadetes bacterium]|nr:type 2 lantipeptide synthetase LanM [Armatimonadota bacterium]